MNCRRFQDQLPEYVEGTLSAGELAAAQQHLAGCNICRKAVQAEQQRSQALSAQLRQMTEGLTLRPEIVRNVLRASRAARPAAAESLAGLWMRWLKLAAMPASLLFIAAFLLAVHFFGAQPHQKPGPVAIHPLPSPPADHPPSTVSTEISYHMPVHEFRQEGNLVVDSFVDETVVASLTLPSGNQKSVPRQPQTKTSL